MKKEDIGKKFTRVFGTEEGIEVLKWLEKTYCGKTYVKTKIDGPVSTQPYDLFYRTGAADVVRDILKKVGSLR